MSGDNNNNMSAQLQDITNTAKVLEGFYTHQADMLPINYMQHDAYFMSLEDLTLNGVSNNIINCAMEACKEHHLIPEWRRAIENNMDYNVGSGEPSLTHKMDKYCQWVTAGMGEEYFVEMDSENKYLTEYPYCIDTDDDDSIHPITRVSMKHKRQCDEGYENHYTDSYNDVA